MNDTPATGLLVEANVAFASHVFDYVDRGGTRHSAATLGVDEHAVLKTLLFEDEAARPVCVVMHGDRMVSEGRLAAALGVTSVRACDIAVAERHSGYQVGGTSPLGLATPMPVLLEASALALPRVWVNGGRRGFLVSLDPRDLQRVLGARAVSVATDRRASRPRA
jgi:Cys-tRNA(Pro) deacylase